MTVCRDPCLSVCLLRCERWNVPCCACLPCKFSCGWMDRVLLSGANGFISQEIFSTSISFGNLKPHLFIPPGIPLPAELLWLPDIELYFVGICFGPIWIKEIQRYTAHTYLGLELVLGKKNVMSDFMLLEELCSWVLRGILLNPPTLLGSLNAVALTTWQWLDVAQLFPALCFLLTFLCWVAEDWTFHTSIGVLLVVLWGLTMARYI